MAPLATTLVLGGARSGKSRHAETLVRGSGSQRIYLATAAVGDAEMAERIGSHRQERGPDWLTIEEQFELAGTLAREARPGRAILVDCLTLWLSNLMLADRDLGKASADLCELLPNLPCPVVLVSNEVGMGLVPETPLGRRFRDAQGRLNQAVAAAVPNVVFVAAGLPLTLKQAGDAGIRSNP
jgi:adenosylcobinamide kinase/adenosylcobinamide-phosphate guanylyltransferase